MRQPGGAGWLRIAATAALLLISSSLAARGEFAVLAHFQDPRVDESSGLAASARSDAYFFTHNDSGDGPFVYCISRQGSTLATYRLAGAQALDWEDMARGPGPTGIPSLYVGDIGDNLEIRRTITVYRVPEPVPPPRPPARPPSRGAETPLTGVTAAVFRYPDGAHNAEALLVHPRTGQIFVATKLRGQATFYAAPHPLPAAAPVLLRKLTTLALPLTSVRGGPPPRPRPGAALATGGDISADGRRLVLRTYVDAYEWDLPPGGPGDNADLVHRALSTVPRILALPEREGGEAICYTRSGYSLLLSVEGSGAPVHLLTR